MNVIVTVDLGFGDQGKGSIVDWLVRHHEASLVVRYNGGPQAAHRVVDGDREHIFSQFGSGTLAGARTHLGPEMLVNPLNLMREALHLREIGIANPMAGLTIDARCVVVTPFQIAANRIRELMRGPNRHGSCGQGIGETRSDVLHNRETLTVGQLFNEQKVFDRLVRIQKRKLREMYEVIRHGRKTALLAGYELAEDEIDAELQRLEDAQLPALLVASYREIQPNVVLSSWLDRQLGKTKVTVFEGAQGVLLDQNQGFHPYTTWSDTTVSPAAKMLMEARFSGSVRTIGITRAYMTRHGPGPFPTEDTVLSRDLTDESNQTGVWQGEFRIGYPDLIMLEYALRVAPVDEIALTCVDRIEQRKKWLVARNYALVDPRSEPHSPQKLPFKMDGWRVAGLPYVSQMKKDAPDLTRLLMHNVVALYDSLEPTVEAYADLFARELGVPIGIVSRGPAAQDKTVLKASP